MKRLVLALFDGFAWALRLGGVNYEHFRALLDVKLTLDARRALTPFNANATRASRNTFALTLLVSAFMGLMVAPLAALLPPLTAMTMVHGFILVMISLTLIADYSSVLLDTTDNLILQPRPITSRTVLAARIAHIVAYLTMLALSLSAASFVVGTFRFGLLFPPLFLGTLLCGVLLALAGVTLVYLLLMRWTTGERLRDIILYFQIAMTVIVMGGYQVLPRLIEWRRLAHLDLADSPWLFLLPPAWLAAPFDMLRGHGDLRHVALTTLGVVVPCLAMLLANRLAPVFKQALTQLDAGPQRQPTRQTPRRGDRVPFARLVTRDPIERAAFEFLWHITTRDRQFKLRTYPSVAFSIVFGVSFLFMPINPKDQQSFAAGPAHLFVLYLTTAMMPAVFLQLRYSDQKDAAAIFRALPLAAPGPVLMAGVKVVCVQMLLPTMALASALVLTLRGWRVLPDVALAACGGLLVAASSALMLGRRMPFSETFSGADASGRTVRVFALLLLPATLGFLHFGLTFAGPTAVLVACVPVLTVAWALARVFRRTPWRVVLQSS